MLNFCAVNTLDRVFLFNMNQFEVNIKYNMTVLGRGVQWLPPLSRTVLGSDLLADRGLSV